MSGRVIALTLAVAACGRINFDPLAGVADGPGGDGAAECRVRLGAGRLHSCAIAGDGRVWCWGDGMYGQIGDSFTMDRTVPTLVPDFLDTFDVAGGRFETCIARANGTAHCWGEGDSGQLGDGAGVTSPTPVPVANLSGVVDVAAAAVHSCARLTSGAVWCWGSGLSGRLGTGNLNSSNVPVQVMGITDAIAVASGGSTTCAILADRTLRCWGFNQYGEVGNNSQIDALTPQQPVGIGEVIAVQPRDNTTCAVRAPEGGVQCWGRNDQGNCGTGATSGPVLVPTPTVLSGGFPLNYADEVAIGVDHACARVNEAVYCWGNDAYGQLGDGTPGGVRPYAAPVVGLPEIVHLASAAYSTCAVDAGGVVWCWGQGVEGQLGDGTTTAAQPTPQIAFDGCP